MERKVYITDGVLSLVEYLPEDYRESYNNWLDPDTQNGFNFALNITYEEFCAKRLGNNSFFAAVMLNATEQVIGEISLSPEGMPPDLAIRIYKVFRNNGYGTRAFQLGIKHCFDIFGLKTIYAGCYPDNFASQKMLRKCGFTPHPAGNLEEKHYLTGEPVIQYDYILHNH